MRTTTCAVVLSALIGALFGGCAAPEKDIAPSASAQRAGMTRKVTTDSPQAQEWFDRGLFLCYAFDHEQAEVAFRRALEHDPNCAMAYWGIAYASGPNINNMMMDEQHSKTAHDAITKAKQLRHGCSPVECDLIDAMAVRYEYPAPDDRRKLDESYAEAMREVRRKHPEDADVGAIFAESLMDLYAWKLWTPAGEPSPVTVELVGVLEDVLVKHPEHIGASHDYIHTMEASKSPGKADGAANRLRNDSLGAPHLVHMPSHIDIRRGRYEQAVEANQNAIKADLVRIEAVGDGGFFALYRAHNYHFLQYAAMFDGQKEVAIEAARGVVATLPPDAIEQYPLMLEGFLGAPYHAMVRFGMWDEILAEPAPPPGRPITTATHHYARGIALATRGKVEEARAEREAFLAAKATIPPDAFIGNNEAATVILIGEAMLEGEIEYRAGNDDRAFELLRDAVAKNDALSYDEPWGWMQPPRHALGALLLERGRVEEAEAVYVADLKDHPGNGWALFGLAECYERTGRKAEHATTLAAARKAWARSDIPLTVSCYCRVSSSR
ncbi:MAG: tetratricopeptide repeat protein [Phycisphaeraceae bacterium]|nr:tetratricopeptide repeat protein [Phycisphaeraceae bacterium]